jgi:acyl carrier protein
MMAGEMLSPAEVRDAVRQIIASVKQLDPSEIDDFSPLFSEAEGLASGIELDSLDTLDLALELRERFDPEGDRLEQLLNGEIDPTTISTVTKIAEFIMSAMPAAIAPSDLSGDQPSVLAR